MRTFGFVFCPLTRCFCGLVGLSKFNEFKGSHSDIQLAKSGNRHGRLIFLAAGIARAGVYHVYETSSVDPETLQIENGVITNLTAAGPSLAD